MRIVAGSNRRSLARDPGPEGRRSAEGRGRTGTVLADQRFLRPPRLPIPPLRRRLWPASRAGPRGGSRCRGTGSNRGHHDFQSCALPTELPRRVSRSFLAVPRICAGALPTSFFDIVAKSARLRQPGATRKPGLTAALFSLRLLASSLASTGSRSVYTKRSAPFHSAQRTATGISIRPPRWLRAEGHCQPPVRIVSSAGRLAR